WSVGYLSGRLFVVLLAVGLPDAEGWAGGVCALCNGCSRSGAYPLNGSSAKAVFRLTRAHSGWACKAPATCSSAPFLWTG
ncbi:hypothetical protein COO60DRAFT_1528585, partial [Scenedesmus sp. NREL 46B-D3]